MKLTVSDNATGTTPIDLKKLGGDYECVVIDLIHVYDALRLVVGTQNRHRRLEPTAHILLTNPICPTSRKILQPMFGMQTDFYCIDRKTNENV